MCPYKLADDFCPSAAFKRQAEACHNTRWGHCEHNDFDAVDQNRFSSANSRTWSFGTVRSFNKKSVESRGTRRGLTLNLA
jgi:hypothetical protein